MIKKQRTVGNVLLIGINNNIVSVDTHDIEYLLNRIKELIDHIEINEGKSVYTEKFYVDTIINLANHSHKFHIET